jgi:hypothetical protein
LSALAANYGRLSAAFPSLLVSPGRLHALTAAVGDTARRWAALRSGAAAALFSPVMISHCTPFQVMPAEAEAAAASERHLSEPFVLARPAGGGGMNAGEAVDLILASEGGGWPWPESDSDA